MSCRRRVSYSSLSLWLTQLSPRYLSDGLHQSPLEDIVLPPCSPIDASYRPQAVSEPLPAPGQFPESMLLFSKPLDTSELQRVSGNSLRDPSFMEMSPPIQLPPGSRSIIAASAMPTGHQHQLLPLLGSRVFHPPASSTMPLQHAYAPLRRSTAAPAARSTSKPLQPRKQPLQRHINGWPGNESWTPPPGSRRLATAGLRLEPAVLSSLVPAKSAARRKPVKAM